MMIDGTIGSVVEYAVCVVVVVAVFLAVFGVLPGSVGMFDAGARAARRRDRIRRRAGLRPFNPLLDPPEDAEDREG
jgi:hypothetical protein